MPYIMQYSVLVLAVLCVFVASSAADDTTSNPSPADTTANSTTKEIKPTTTTESPTSTTKPSEAPTAPPTPNPPEVTNNYTYYKNKTACLKAVFSAHFQRGEKVWNVSKDAHIDNGTSRCDVLTVKFGGNDFSIIFNKTEKGAFYICEVRAKLGDDKPDATGLTTAKAAKGSSYMCESGLAIVMTHNVTMYMKDIQLQAYEVKDGKFATAQKCDSDLSPLVPIIVGAVLAGLIIIVVVAYFIGRRRNRTGYEEI